MQEKVKLVFYAMDFPHRLTCLTFAHSHYRIIALQHFRTNALSHYRTSCKSRTRQHKHPVIRSFRFSRTVAFTFLTMASEVPPAVQREDAVGYAAVIASSNKRKAEEDVLAKRKAPDTPPHRPGIVRVSNGQLAFLDDGFPVFKVGYDRFLSVRLNTSQKDSTWLYYILGEWKLAPTGGWQMTDKILRISASQFCRLAGLIMSGKGDLAPGSEERAMYHLGNGLYFNWGHYNRSHLATVRAFQLGASGDLTPTKRGISFGVRCFDTIKKLLMDGKIFEEMAKLKPGFAKDGLDYPNLKPAVHNMLMDQVEKVRGNLCTPCQDPDSSDLHSCKLATVKNPPTEDEWKLAEDEVIKAKGVEAFLLLNDRVAPDQFLKLNVVEFFQKHREVLRKL